MICTLLDESKNGNQETGRNSKKIIYMEVPFAIHIVKFNCSLRSARSVSLLILLSICGPSYAFNSINTYSGNVSVRQMAGPHFASGMVDHSVKNEDTIKPASKEISSIVSKEEFKKQALAKIKEFQGCLYILCDKKAGFEAQDNAVDQGSSLFVDGAIIEVSSINSDEKKHLKVRDFLDKLRNLRYEHIQITFSHVDYVSNIRKGSDGKYYGLVSFEQTFRAFSDGRLVYEDETKKTAEVQLIVYERNFQGDAVQKWDVMLSDVEVLGTKTPKR